MLLHSDLHTLVAFTVDQLWAWLVHREQFAWQQAPDPDLQEALFASKVDAFAAEYNHLLVSQLDSQRLYFEALLRKAEGEAQRSQAAARSAAETAEAATAAAKAEARDALQARKAAERKLVGC